MKKCYCFSCHFILIYHCGCTLLVASESTNTLTPGCGKQMNWHDVEGNTQLWLHSGAWISLDSLLLLKGLTDENITLFF